jgi:uncharacterized protein YcbX
MVVDQDKRFVTQRQIPALATVRSTGAFQIRLSCLSADWRRSI